MASPQQQKSYDEALRELQEYKATYAEMEQIYQASLEEAKTDLDEKKRIVETVIEKRKEAQAALRAVEITIAEDQSKTAGYEECLSELKVTRGHWRSKAETLDRQLREKQFLLKKVSDEAAKKKVECECLQEQAEGMRASFQETMTRVDDLAATLPELERSLAMDGTPRRDLSDPQGIEGSFEILSNTSITSLNGTHRGKPKTPGTLESINAQITQLRCSVTQLTALVNDKMSSLEAVLNPSRVLAT